MIKVTKELIVDSNGFAIAYIYKVKLLGITLYTKKDDVQPLIDCRRE